MIIIVCLLVLKVVMINIISITVGKIVDFIFFIIRKKLNLVDLPKNGFVVARHRGKWAAVCVSLLFYAGNLTSWSHRLLLVSSCKFAQNQNMVHLYH